ncbi:MAG: exo-alpha-sialidase [Bryobacteraceae bacterium]
MNPAPTGSLEAHWGIAPDGSPLLSWIEPAADGSYALRYSIRRANQWTEPRTIVANRRFFRQPAESPSVISFPGGGMLAEWVEVPNDKSQAEYIYVSASTDGVQWTVPVMANKDQSAVQHALVSMVADNAREASLVWLEALKGEDAPSNLKRTVVSRDGKVLKEESLDRDVCTCCPTSIVKTSRGLLVAYRDHTSKDIRDIATVRFENGRWTSSRILNADNWEISACPVNGASAAARGNRVAIAWYTEGDDKPRVQLVFSSDSGATFTKPIVMNTGNAFGHASTALAPDGGAFVSWIEEVDDDSTRVLVRFVSAAGVAGPPIEVVKGSLRALGYPRLLQAGRETWIAWGNSSSGRVQTARLRK